MDLALWNHEDKKHANLLLSLFLKIFEIPFMQFSSKSFVKKIYIKMASKFRDFVTLKSKIFYGF